MRLAMRGSHLSGARYRDWRDEDSYTGYCEGVAEEVLDAVMGLL
jgi:hypothetical protein